MSLAVGPLGRNGEASGALSTKGKVATMFVHYITLVSNTRLTSFQVQVLEDARPFRWRGIRHRRATGCELTRVSRERKLEAIFERCHAATRYSLLSAPLNPVPAHPADAAWVADDQSSHDSSYAFGESDFSPTGRSRTQHTPGQSLNSSMGSSSCI
jgi:hypothetical protein